jgi:hypothetical protein
MGIGTNWLDIRERVALPCLGRAENYHEWLRDFAKFVTAGPRDGQTHRYHIRDNMVIETHKITVHSFQMGDVDDPDLYAAQPLWDWQQSDHGKWVMEHASDTPEWHRIADPINWGHKYVVTAVFESKKLSEYYLRFGKITL